MKAILPWAGMTGIFFLIALTLNLFLHWDFFRSLRVVFGAVYVIFLPGFFLVRALFSRKEMDWLERMTISLVLSLVSVPITIFMFNRIGIKINTLNVSLEILFLIVGSILIKGARAKRMGSL